MKDFIKLKKLAKHARVDILRMHYLSGSSHIGSSLSVIDLLIFLYFKVLRVKPDNCYAANRDRLLLSKGHAVSALYSALCLKGFFKEGKLKSFCRDGSAMFGHSTYASVAGVELSSGSLGHGLAIGAGMALAHKDDRLQARVFVILSDGECNEGSVWESALFSGHHKLDNLIAVVDYNKLQAFGLTKEVLNLEPFADKWRSFGWEVREIDGHDFFQMQRVFSKLPFQKNKPSVVIAHTVKGKGVSFMENQLKWHYKSPNKQELESALKELQN